MLTRTLSLLTLLLALGCSSMWAQGKSVVLQKQKLENWPQIEDPETITTIDLKRNKLTEIPDEIAQFKNLRVLRLARNPITKISEKIEELTQLEHLDLWDADLSELPEAIFRMKHLKVLDLRLCPIPNELIERLVEELPNTKIHFTYNCNC